MPDSHPTLHSDNASCGLQTPCCVDAFTAHRSTMSASAARVRQAGGLDASSEYGSLVLRRSPECKGKKAVSWVAPRRYDGKMTHRRYLLGCVMLGRSQT